MQSYKIEDSIINSVGRDSNGDPVDEITFQVVSCGEHNYLFKGEYHPNKIPISQCVNSYYKERFGDIKSWLKHKLKRETELKGRLDRTIEDLIDQRKTCSNLIWDIKEVL